MNGPEHYREAERILGVVDQAVDLMQSGAARGSQMIVDAGFKTVENMVAIAQVHATLADAAARIDASEDNQRFHQWDQAFKNGATE